MKKISLAVPVFFEEEVILQFIKETEEVLQNLPYDYEYVFVDDGSSDNTVELIKSEAEKNDKIKLIVLSYNQGKAFAATAAFQYATGDFIIYMDPDLQDPPVEIPKFIEKLEADYDLVWGIRKTKEDKGINKLFSNIFWWTLNKFTGLQIPRGIAVMRGFNRPFRNQLLKYKEQNRFLEGLFYKVGGKTTQLMISQRERYAGKSKFNMNRKMKLAFDAIYDFSALPLKLSIRLGMIITFLGFFIVVLLGILKLFIDFQSGWVSIASLILISLGMQLVSVGILANYIGRIYLESKRRPLFSIKEKINLP